MTLVSSPTSGCLASDSPCAYLVLWPQRITLYVVAKGHCHLERDDCQKVSAELWERFAET